MLVKNFVGRPKFRTFIQYATTIVANYALWYRYPLKMKRRSTWRIFNGYSIPAEHSVATWLAEKNRKTEESVQFAQDRTVKCYVFSF